MVFGAYFFSSLPPILNQGDLGGCVANAFSICISIQTSNVVNQSRLFHYANSRILDFTPLNQDDGTTIRTACTALFNHGACQESVWPYNIKNYNMLPPLSAYQAAKRFKTFTYVFIAQTAAAIKACLTTYKTPIIFGFLVYSSFMTNAVTSTGQVPIPNTQNESLEGGHCMIIVGFNDTTQKFICANSWGGKWGDGGLCYIPYAYLLNSKLASDFTVLLTPIYNGKLRILNCSECKNNCFTVYGEGEFYWSVIGKRYDIDTEPYKKSVNVKTLKCRTTSKSCKEEKTWTRKIRINSN